MNTFISHEFFMDVTGALSIQDSVNKHKSSDLSVNKHKSFNLTDIESLKGIVPSYIFLGFLDFCTNIFDYLQFFINYDIKAKQKTYNISENPVLNKHEPNFLQSVTAFSNLLSEFELIQTQLKSFQNLDFLNSKALVAKLIPKIMKLISQLIQFKQLTWIPLYTNYIRQENEKQDDLNQENEKQDDLNQENEKQKDLNQKDQLLITLGRDCDELLNESLELLDSLRLIYSVFILGELNWQAKNIIWGNKVLSRDLPLRDFIVSTLDNPERKAVAFLINRKVQLKFLVKKSV